MKLISFGLLTLAGLNLISARAVMEKRAINDKNQCNDQYCYWVSGPSGGTATIVGFGNKNKNSKVVNVPNKVVFEGHTYYVNSVGYGAFGRYDQIEEVNIASGIDNLDLSHGAFAENKNLKRVVLNSPVSALDLTAFSSPHKDCVFLGKGVKSFTDGQVKRLLISFGIKTKDYSKIDDYTRKVDLFELAKTLSQYLKVSDIKDSGNAIAALEIKFATSAGYARLYRLLAIAMGVPEKDILVGHDGNGNYFNYTKLDNVWFNLSVDYPFRRYSLYYQTWQYEFFVDNATFKSRIKSKTSPSSWYVMFSNYGYSDEFRGQQSYDIFDQYLKQNRLGSRI